MPLIFGEGNVFASSTFVLFKGICLQNKMEGWRKSENIIVKGKNPQLWLFHTEFQIAAQPGESDLFLAIEVIQAVN